MWCACWTPGLVRVALPQPLSLALCEQKHGVLSIDATLYELDPLIQDALLETMQDCQRLCDEAGIRFSFIIHATDFIQEMSARLADNLFVHKAARFRCRHCKSALPENRHGFG